MNLIDLIAGVGQISRKAARLLWLYPISLYGGWTQRSLFDNVRTSCMFIGYPRSGHSLIGSLLDAHPHAIVAHELDALQFIHAGYGRRQLYYLLLKNSQTSGKRRRTIGNYSYVIGNQWQGKVDSLHVIGEKHAEGTTLRFQAWPWLLERLQRTMKAEMRFIHTIRNPFDNITTISMRTKVRGRPLDLQESVNYYFSLCKTVVDVKRQIGPGNLFEIRHEAFIEDPQRHLSDLCEFLGLDASESYLKACGEIVYKTPHQSRFEVQWSAALIDQVNRNINEFSFLHGYTFGGLEKAVSMLSRPH